MILTVVEFRQLYQTDTPDDVLYLMLEAVESLVRAYTNNSFRERGMGQKMTMTAQTFSAAGMLLPFHPGDLVEVSNSAWNDGLYTIQAVEGSSIRVNEQTKGMDTGVVWRVKYPSDVKMGVVNMLKWDIEKRAKMGISSETLSRHSVTYTDTANGNAIMGYPKALTTFLTPYKRARFGGA